MRTYSPVVLKENKIYYLNMNGKNPVFDICIILAGGSGTRLWPASSSRLPKQFLLAGKKKSFFLMALERAAAVTDKNGRVLIITGKPHIPHVIENISKLKPGEKKQILVIEEPAAKNTAPAIACAVRWSVLDSAESKDKHGGKKILVLTSDHIIKPLDIFKADAAQAAEASGEQMLVVFGISPSRPETDYGYIKIMKETLKKKKLYKVEAFREKPCLTDAKKYAASGLHYWNSGMFAFSDIFMEKQFNLHCPDVYSHFQKLKPPKPGEFTVRKGVKILTAWQGLETAYKKASKVSFDYAVAEKCGKTAMIRSNFDWIDIGNWDEYIKISAPLAGRVYTSSQENRSYVDSDIPVALAGVDDLIVVIRSGKNGKGACALITKKGASNKVRAVVEKIQKDGNRDLL